MTEEWRTIPGWPDYQVSDAGRFARTQNGVRVVRKLTRKGYKIVSLYRGPLDRIQVGLHTLVMLAFVGPCPEGMEVCHNDGNPENNALSNLRYDTRSANVTDSWAERITARDTGSMPDRAWVTTSEAAEYVGCNPSTFRHAIRRGVITQAVQMADLWLLPRELVEHYAETGRWPAAEAAD